MNRTPNAFFVYGTLQRGEERAGCWPAPPQGVEAAFLRAALYDLGDYPAIAEGEDRVLGEVWRFAPEDMSATVEALDAVEGFQQGEPDLYLRRAVECETMTGERVAAFAYYWANPRELARFPRIGPGDQRFCDWKQRKPRADGKSA